MASSRLVSIALVALGAISPSPVAAQQHQPATARLAVLEFKNLTSDHADQRRSELLFLTDLVRNRSKDLLPWMEVITRENIVAVLAAQNRTLDDCSKDDECEVQTGQRLGADYVVSGELLLLGNALRLSLKLHNTKTTALLKGVSMGGSDVTNLEDVLKRTVPELLAPLLESPNPRVGQLIIQSRPDGASLSVNGRPSGLTPAVLPLLPGSVQIALGKEHFLDWTGAAVIRAGETITFEVAMKSLDLAQVEAEQRSRARTRALYWGVGAVGLGAAGGVAQSRALSYASAQHAAEARYATATNQAALDTARHDADSSNRAAHTGQALAIGLAATACALAVVGLMQLLSAP